ncbi:PLAC8 family protein [Euphorbia peplus]|nr:PLAC8 family protein [Euphorbia peplus]
MGSSSEENPKKLEVVESNGAKLSNATSSRRTLLSDEDPQNNGQDTLSALPNRLKFLQIGSASAKFRRLAQDKDDISRSVSSSSHGIRERINGVFSRKIDWDSVMKMAKEWMRNPMNLALFVWILCVAISGAILFLVMTGMLNAVLPKKSQRNVWFEVNNQILNALFTLMCLYQHPKRFYHLVLLCRWKPDDISKMRKLYCKNGTYKPHEWMHMMVVVLLLHLNCFAQYALCGLNIGYSRSERPAIGVGICISCAIAAPAIAGVYTIKSPLGRDYDSEMDEEAQVHISADENTRTEQSRLRTIEKRFSFATRDEEGRVEARPLWSGGVLDFWDDISLAYLSLFCSFCVFGWNMERLGFGNMYVHIATFVLFCMAPFWIFNLAAVNIDNEAVRQALGLTGIILCVFGLLYGGFWRIQMRKRFHLPTYTFCFGKPSVSDCMLWLCCCWCSLAQEVRTANSYDIVHDKFYKKQVDTSSNHLQPLPPESVSGPSSPFSNIPPKTSSEHHNQDIQLSTVNRELTANGKDETMTPPSPSVIERHNA